MSDIERNAVSGDGLVSIKRKRPQDSQAPATNTSTEAQQPASKKRMGFDDLETVTWEHAPLVKLEPQQISTLANSTAGLLKGEQNRKQVMKRLAELKSNLKSTTIGHASKDELDNAPVQ